MPTPAIKDPKSSRQMQRVFVVMYVKICVWQMGKSGLTGWLYASYSPQHSQLLLQHAQTYHRLFGSEKDLTGKIEYIFVCHSDWMLIFLFPVLFRFLLQCLEDLDASLRKLNSRLFVIRGQPANVFPRLFKVSISVQLIICQTHSTAIFWPSQINCNEEKCQKLSNC